jgi:chromosome partitioning protein
MFRQSLVEILNDLHESSDNVQEVALRERAERNAKLYSLQEVAEMIGVSDTFLRGLAKDGKVPPGELKSNNRRYYTVDEIFLIREQISNTSAKHDKFGIFEDSGICKVVAVANFKGGVAKTTLSVHLAQYLALQGYRVCLCDLDAQGSATSLFGFNPHLDFSEEDTIVPFVLREEESRAQDRSSIEFDLSHAIHDSGFSENLKIMPGNNDLSCVDSTLPAIQMRNNKFKFWTQLHQGLETIKPSFDVIVLDSPPNLGYLTMNGIYACDGLVVPVPPSMIDFSSSSAFFDNCADFVQTIQKHDDKLIENDFVRVVPTKCPVFTDLSSGDKEDRRQSMMILNDMMKVWGPLVTESVLLSSEAIREASKTFQTVYEKGDWQATRQTVRRCLSSLNSVCGELEGLIYKSMCRSLEQLEQSNVTNELEELA